MDIALTIAKFISKHRKYRHSLITVFAAIPDKGWDQCKLDFIASTSAPNSIAGAISFYGRKIERNAIEMPSCDDLSMMVDDLIRKRHQADLMQARKRTKTKAKAAQEYYPRSGW